MGGCLALSLNHSPCFPLRGRSPGVPLHRTRHNFTSCSSKVHICEKLDLARDSPGTAHLNRSKLAFGGLDTRHGMHAIDLTKKYMKCPLLGTNFGLPASLHFALLPHSSQIHLQLIVKEALTIERGIGSCYLLPSYPTFTLLKNPLPSSIPTLLDAVLHFG